MKVVVGAVDNTDAPKEYTECVKEVISAMPRVREPLKGMHIAIDKLYEGDIESALSSFLDISRNSGKRILQAILGENEYGIATNIAYVLQSAILYYFAQAIKKQRQGDIISSLAYLSYSSGINSVLDTIIMPTVRKYANQFDSQKEIEALEMMQSSIEQKIGKMSIHAIATLRGEEKEESLERVSKSVKNMLSLASTVCPEVRELAVKLGIKFPAGDFKQARRVYEFVRDEIQYISDPLGIEEIQSPETTLRLSSGDCDDKAVLLASLLLAIGFETCFFVVDVDNDGFPDHVYSGVYLPSAPEYCKPFPRKLLSDGKNFHDWIPLDPVYEDSDIGVIPIIDLGILQYIPVPPAKEDATHKP